MVPPPPADPIRPIGPVAGDVFVGRSELSERVLRRPRREDKARDRQRRRQPAAEDVPVADGDEDPYAGTYDDHGRVPPHEPPAERPHIDARA